ncbi:MAG: ABC transporter substrate-binding protein [Candidatus Tectomicrobia bacterium]|uniref:ABC transporter substrate-binding protein n=1 Tax=Tectimicrobiota bacterium TaxID=2528274 RepID=A0A933LQ67_UNCTE|nr:ABC transporter substrate-binding protein [Candidatus Tectomicrobia bacterium]
MRNSKLILLFTLIFALAAVLLFKVPALEAQEVFKVAVVAPLSGPGAPWGEGMLRGLILAVDEVNAKGGMTVEGKKYKVEVIGYDDKYNAKFGVDAVNRAIFTDKVKFIFGSISSAVVVAFQAITEPNKILVLADTYSPKILGPDKPFTMRVVMSSAEIAPIMYKFLRQKYPEIKKVAILSPNDESGWAVTEHSVGAIKEVGGLEVVFNEFYERGTKDFYPLLTRILEKKPDLIDPSASAPGDLALILKQARELGYKGMTMSTPGQKAEVIAKQAGPGNANGHMYPASVDLKVENPKVTALKKAYQAKWAGELDPITIAFYDPGRWLFIAIEKANSFDTAKVRDSLIAMEKDGSLTNVNGQAKWGGMKTYGIDKHQIYGKLFLAQVQDEKEVIVHTVEAPENP